MIHFRCPSCQTLLQGDPGVKVNCPHCGQRILAPGQAGRTVLAAPVAPAAEAVVATPVSASAAERPHPRSYNGYVILALGIIGLFWHVLAPAAWIWGSIDLRRMDAGEMDAELRGLTQAGKSCGVAGTIILGIGMALAALFLIVYFGILAGVFFSSL